MHVNTVSDLIAALTLLSLGRDTTEVVVSDDTHQLGLEVYLENDSIVVLSLGSKQPT